LSMTASSASRDAGRLSVLAGLAMRLEQVTIKLLVAQI